MCVCVFSHSAMSDSLWPMDCSKPASSTLHCLLEFSKTHVHRFSDAIQSSHLLLPTSPTAFCLSRHQRLFQWIGSSHHLAKFLELQLLASVLPMNIRGWFPLGLTYLISLQSKRLSRIFSNTTVQQHQFFSTQPSLWSNSHIRTWPLGKPQLWPLSAKWCLCFLMCCLALS